MYLFIYVKTDRKTFCIQVGAPLRIYSTPSFKIHPIAMSLISDFSVDTSIPKTFSIRMCHLVAASILIQINFPDRKIKKSKDLIDIVAVTLNSVLKYYEENLSNQIKIPEGNPGWLRPNTLFISS